MRPVAGDAVAQHEIDQVAWLTRERAATKLTYERDLEVLRSPDYAL
jgi:hypothetical protein